MASRKQHHSQTKGISVHFDLEISKPKNPRNASHTVKFDLMTLLGETPEQSIDFNWENMPPVGKEFR
ncbi:hypothetical protein A1D17_06900 [Pseudomonas fluorescens]|uniref:Uncharacterized protein n=1 Tax=Pseudomonas fluorescens TaxID=294 RepID=A0A166MM36_PSEFL|nr:hypothetical protein A1D17_06900 [Pseudomonas fluorescens]